MNKEILIIAGEASGDLHGASLVNELKRQNPDVALTGICGDKMKNEGVKPLYHINQMAFLGFVEVVKHLPFIKKVQKEIIDYVIKNKIKNAILIDYPGFNLSIAKKLKELDVKVFYYISPQIWAWGGHRINKIKKYVDKMLVLFPFEKDFYSKGKVKVELTGHPLIDQISSYKFLHKEEFYSKFHLDKDKDILLLLPGSRINEINELYPIMLESAKELIKKHRLQAVVAVADNINPSVLGSYLTPRNVQIIQGYTYELFKYSKVGIIKSGTSTLEAGIFGLPMVIIYVTNRITFELGKLLVKIKNIGLINIVLGKTIVPELIQKEVNVKNIVNNISRYLEDNKHYLSTQTELLKVNELLGKEGASEKAAKIILGELA